MSCGNKRKDSKASCDKVKASATPNSATENKENTNE